MAGSSLESVSYTHLDVYKRQHWDRRNLPCAGGRRSVSYTHLHLLERLDGVILSGGDDIHPIHYGEEPKQGLGQVYPERDEMEMALTIACIRQETPVMGICRGLQIINVTLGGDLYQDIYRQMPGRDLLLHNQNIDGEFGNHSIDIDSNSFLYDIYKQKIGWVNSFHHQAIRNLSSALKAIAWSKDGIVEAVSYTHLEKLSDDSLKNKTIEFKERLKNGETLEDILNEAFAVVREVSRRVLKMRHFPVQLLGGIVLHQGRICLLYTSRCV